MYLIFYYFLLVIRCYHFLKTLLSTASSKLSLIYSNISLFTDFCNTYFSKKTAKLFSELARNSSDVWNLVSVQSLEFFVTLLLDLFSTMMTKTFLISKIWYVKKFVYVKSLFLKQNRILWTLQWFEIIIFLFIVVKHFPGLLRFLLRILVWSIKYFNLSISSHSNWRRWMVLKGNRLKSFYHFHIDG